ncbi:MAG: ExbD/TolR family protein [Desulfobacterales bacterium]
MSNKWVLRQEDKLFDPVSLKTLRTWVYENRVSGRDMASCDGGKTWTLAERTPELIPFFPSETVAVSDIPRGYIGHIERKRRSIEVIDMIPMIDMVFLLLIFFALTSSFEIQRALELKLPKASSAVETGKTEKIELYINKENDVFLQNEHVKLGQLQSKLGKVVQDGAEVTLVIKADEHVYHGRVVEVMDIASGAGVKKILITVRRKATSY